MRRLLDDGGTDFEHSLLSALRDEKPSPELVARMQQGLGLSTAATGTAAAASSVGWVKVALVGLAAVGLAGVAYVGLRSADSPVAVLPSVKPVPVKVEAPVTAEPKPVSVSELAVAQAEEPAPSKPRPVASVAPDLREEIRLLDQARSAVRAGDGSQALALLAKYARRYPRGQFRQEAQVLRVEALEQSGNKQAAVALGKKFVAAHPESPHVERVERVTGADR
jgi:TolA-binding protein